MATPDARRAVGWPVALGVVALSVNLVSIARPAVWRDEVASVVVARRSPGAIVSLLRHDDAPLGAYYLFMHFWIKVSESAAWIRLPSAVASAAAVVFLYLLGKRLAGVGVGVVAGLLLAVLPFSTRYAQEARPYALVMCGATAASWLLVRALDDPRRARWLTYAGVLAVTVALHVIAATLLLAHLVTVGWARRAYRPWLLSLLPALAVAVVVSGLTVQEGGHSWITKTQRRTPYDTAVAFAGSRPGLVLIVGVLVAGAVVTLRRGKVRPPVTVASIGWPWLILPPGILMVVSVVHPVFVLRYVLFSLPALALLTASAAFDVWQRIRLPSGQRAVRFGVAALAGCALLAAVAQPQRTLRQLNSHGDNPKAEAAYLASVAKPGDGIVYLTRDLVHSLVIYGPLPTDALLRISADDSKTLNGVEVAPADVAATMLKFQRLWVLYAPGYQDASPWVSAATSTLAAHYRLVSTTDLPGTALVLYQRTGS